ncbi:MAG TPA: PQQ-binding-like beta-propeller repeat protein [Vicinamibacterales bacterium]|nr:PQQ-binding-like beta-propeller repeat protein [Vicinamibacterales bacterium]
MTFAIALVLMRYVVPRLVPDVEISGLPLGIIVVFAGMLSAVAIVIWWLFFSRARWFERLAALALIVVAVVAMRPIVHESIRGGMMGRMLYVYSIPVLCLAIVVGAVLTRRLAGSARLAGLLGTILLACVPFLMIRTSGVMGMGGLFHWRWTETPEQRLLAQANDEPKPIPAPIPAPPAPAEPPEAKAADKPAEIAKPTAEPKVDPAPRAAVETPAEWPGFRGAGRDGVVRSVRINTDWSSSPPAVIWRRPIGPGWSSFAVRGDLLYTQEQRGDDEIVACYKVSTGEPVWRHRDRVRFWESNGGAGPRGTPTIHKNRVYALGATGLINALDASSGAVVWSRNAAADTGVELPGWGFTSSPLVVDDVVIVATSGRLAAYDVETGKPRWLGPTGGGGYSSPHLVTLDGVTQVLLLRGARSTSLAPADGTLLWEYSWQPAVSIVQPAVTADGDILINTADAMGGHGMRRIEIGHGSGGWTTRELWTSRGLKPYFNDFVVHKGHAYGFDGSILACIDVEDGTRKWKGGRYGSGQLILLPEQDVLLVLSEEGELALVGATPDQYTELARVPGIEGKTWNHPALVGNILLVRNGEEMAAFRLSLAGS